MSYRYVLAQVKSRGSFVLPWPWYRATNGYAHNGRAMVTALVV